MIFKHHKKLKLLMPHKHLNAHGFLYFCRPHAQGAKVVEKVHKPPLRDNVIIFELNGLNASI
jgi:hypothetical protein